MSLIVFEDDLVSQLDPVAIGRPAFAISCGGARLIDLLAQLNPSIRISVRPHLKQIVAADFPRLALIDDDHISQGTLLVNARLVPSRTNLSQLKQLAEMRQAGAVYSDQSLAAAWIETAESSARSWRDFLPRLDTADSASAPSALAMGGSTTSPSAGSPSIALPSVPLRLSLLDYPHDIIRHHVATLRETLAERIIHGDLAQVADGVFTAPGATIGQHCVFDTRHGPIVLEAGATVGPYCLLGGPLHLGAGARVLEHAALKDGVAIGHTAKIGGEVEASIIEPYSNKQHHGFLGHSYLGSWINLGAGTCNSDLKNTYGQVNMQYHGRKVATGMQFVGAIIGDYAKTAINTGVFTGKTVGVCSMVYGFVTTNVPSFVNYARLFGQVTEAPVEVMAATQRRMFARRGVEQRPCDVQLLHDMYALTAAERAAGGEALSLEPLSL